MLQLTAIALASWLLGGATSFAQTFLPDALRPFANSASGWTLLTATMVGVCRVRTVPSAVCGAASFVALVLGYQFVSGLRGFPTDETLFLVVGVVVGPFIGLAASWLRRHGVRAVIACGVLAGVAVGEGVYGLVVISGTTGWFYWTLVAVAGVALTAVTLHRLDRGRHRIGAVGLVAAVATAFFAGYQVIGAI